MTQSKPAPEPKPISLRMAVYGFVVVGAVIAGLASLIFVAEQKAAYQSAALDVAVRVRLQGVEFDLAQSLDQDWRQVRALSERIGADPTADQRALFDFMAANDARIAWVGWADVGGTVVDGTGGRLKGKNVADLPAFQTGLEESQAGLLDEAALPIKPARAADGGPGQYVYFTTPVKTPDGGVAGAVGALIDLSSVASLLSENAAALNLDVYLVSQDGAVIVASDGVTPGQLDLASMRIAATGVEGSQMELWPDGKQYATSVIPQVAHGDLPALGWRLVGRIDPKEFLVADSELFRSTLKLAAVLVLVTVILSILFVHIFILPFQILARNADRIANGIDEYPYEGRQTSEIALLSAALVRLKGQHD